MHWVFHGFLTETILFSVFLGLMSLSFLSLDFNRIQKVPEKAFADLQNLNSLHLEYNHVSYLNESSLMGLEGELERSSQYLF